jgi:multidrug efflux pump subunit AcrA (membrane-fusion protein)
MRRIVLLFGGLWLALLPSSLNATESVVTLPDCLLELSDEAEIPAQEPGALAEIRVREGQPVSKGDFLARIDDRIPQLQQRVAGFKLDVAKRQALDDIDHRFATAAYEVADADCKQDKEANERLPGTVPQADVRRRLLEREKMKLSIEKADKDLAVAELQAKVAQGELDAATEMIARRRLIAPFDDAIVVELKRHVGEWVQAGEPVMRLVSMGHLRVAGSLDATKQHPSDIKGRPVEVVVTLPDKRVERFDGTIVYVKPVIEGGMFEVRAEIKNRKQNDDWLVYPGMRADMTIRLK